MSRDFLPPNVNTMVGHPSGAEKLGHIARANNLRLFVHEKCPPGLMFAIDSNSIVAQDLRTGRIWKPFAEMLGDDA